MNEEDVLSMLSASRVAPEIILRALQEVAAAHNVGAPPWSRGAILVLLDALAAKSGTLAISARFAKARFLLRR